MISIEIFSELLALFYYFKRAQKIWQIVGHEEKKEESVPALIPLTSKLTKSPQTYTQTPISCCCFVRECKRCSSFWGVNYISHTHTSCAHIAHTQRTHVCAHTHTAHTHILTCAHIHVHTCTHKKNKEIMIFFVNLGGQNSPPNIMITASTKTHEMFECGRWRHRKSVVQQFLTNHLFF